MEETLINFNRSSSPKKLLKELKELLPTVETPLSLKTKRDSTKDNISLEYDEQEENDVSRAPTSSPKNLTYANITNLNTSSDSGDSIIEAKNKIIERKNKKFKSNLNINMGKPIVTAEINEDMEDTVSDSSDIDQIKDIIIERKKRKLQKKTPISFVKNLNQEVNMLNKEKSDALHTSSEDSLLLTEFKDIKERFLKGRKSIALNITSELKDFKTNSQMSHAELSTAFPNSEIAINESLNPSTESKESTVSQRKSPNDPLQNYNKEYYSKNEINANKANNYPKDSHQIESTSENASAHSEISDLDDSLIPSKNIRFKVAKKRKPVKLNISSELAAMQANTGKENIILPANETYDSLSERNVSTSDFSVNNSLNNESDMRSKIPRKRKSIKLNISSLIAGMQDIPNTENSELSVRGNELSNNMNRDLQSLNKLNLSKASVGNSKSAYDISYEVDKPIESNSDSRERPDVGKQLQTSLLSTSNTGMANRSLRENLRSSGRKHLAKADLQPVNDQDSFSEKEQEENNNTLRSYHTIIPKETELTKVHTDNLSSDIGSPSKKKNEQSLNKRGRSSSPLTPNKRSSINKDAELEPGYNIDEPVDTEKHLQSSVLKSNTRMTKEKGNNTIEPLRRSPRKHSIKGDLQLVYNTQSFSEKEQETTIDDALRRGLTISPEKIESGVVQRNALSSNIESPIKNKNEQSLNKLDMGNSTSTGIASPNKKSFIDKGTASSPGYEILYGLDEPVNDYTTTSEIPDAEKQLQSSLLKSNIRMTKEKEDNFRENPRRSPRKHSVEQNLQQVRDQGSFSEKGQKQKSNEDTSTLSQPISPNKRETGSHKNNETYKESTSIIHSYAHSKKSDKALNAASSRREKIEQLSQDIAGIDNNVSSSSEGSYENNSPLSPTHSTKSHKKSSDLSPDRLSSKRKVEELSALSSSKSPKKTRLSLLQSSSTNKSAVTPSKIPREQLVSSLPNKSMVDDSESDSSISSYQRNLRLSTTSSAKENSTVQKNMSVNNKTSEKNIPSVRKSPRNSPQKNDHGSTSSKDIVSSHSESKKNITLTEAESRTQSFNQSVRSELRNSKSNETHSTKSLKTKNRSLKSSGTKFQKIGERLFSTPVGPKELMNFTSVGKTPPLLHLANFLLSSNSEDVAHGINSSLESNIDSLETSHDVLGGESHNSYSGLDKKASQSMTVKPSSDTEKVVEKNQEISALKKPDAVHMPNISNKSEISSFVLRNKSRNDGPSTSKASNSNSKQPTLAEFLQRISTGKIITKKMDPEIEKIINRPLILHSLEKKAAEPQSLNKKPKKKLTKGEGSFSIPTKLNKTFLEHFCKHKVSKEAVTAFQEASKVFFEHLASDLNVVMTSKGEKIISKNHPVRLMKELNLIKSKTDLHQQMREMLPVNEWEKVIPVRYAFNKVFPKT